MSNRFDPDHRPDASGAAWPTRGRAVRCPQPAAREAARPPLAADDSARSIASNTLAQQLTGYSADEVRHMRLEDITPLPAGGRRGSVDDFIAHGAQQGEYEVRRRNGPPVRVRYWAYASVARGFHVSLLVRMDSA